jgi:hypothetical protein
MKSYIVTLERIVRHGPKGGQIVKWVGSVDGKFSSESQSRADALKWAQQHARWLRDRDAIAAELG